MPFNLNHQILEEAQRTQSTHNHVTSNAAAMLAIRLASKYFLPEHKASSSSQAASSSSVTASSSSSSTKENSSMTLGISHNSAAITKNQHIRARYEHRTKSSLLELSTRSWLSTILDKNILNKEFDRVTLVEEREGKRVSTEWYLPLPEIFAIVLCALMDKHEQAWPVPPGSTATRERLLRLQKFDLINNELMNEIPSICSAGIRHRWLMALDGYEGKRLPLNAEDVLMQGLFDFMVHEVLETQLKLKLPDGRDPAGDEYIPFYERFQSLFLPWIFDTIPDEVKAAIRNAGQEDAAKEYILKRFRTIQTIPSDNMLTKINGYCSYEGLISIPCNFVPILAALDRFAKRHAMALSSGRIAATSLHSLASQTIAWLKGPGFSPESLKNADAEKKTWDTVYLVMRLHDVLYQYKDYKNLLQVCDMPPEHKTEWLDSLLVLEQWLNNQELSLQALLADTASLEQQLRAFERGVSFWRSNTYYDFISNYTAQWFAARNEGDIPVLASLFARLCELFFNENTPEAHSNPAIRVDDALLSKWMTQTAEDGTLDVSPYQINRIILHALCYEPNTWSLLFRRCLTVVLTFIHNRCNQGLNSAGEALFRDSWPQELLDQIEYQLNSEQTGESPVPVIFTPGTITFDTSLDTARLLAISSSMPEHIIKKIVEHPGFNPNATDDLDLTPFYIAAEFGNIPFANALRARDAEYKVSYKGLYKPMVAALENQHFPFLQWFLQTLDDLSVLDELTTRDANGSYLMKRLASNPQDLIDILRCLPEHIRKEALLAEDNRGLTGLRLFTQHPLFIKDVVNCLPEDERAKAFMKDQIAARSLFHIAATEQPDIIIQLLEGLPEIEREPFLLTESQDGNTMLHHAAEKYPELLISIVSYLPKTRRISPLSAKNNENVSVLHQVAISHPKLLERLFLLIPSPDRYYALTQQTQNNNTLLHDVAVIAPQILIKLLDCLPKTRKEKAIMAINKDGDTILHLIAPWNYPKILLKLFNYLPLELKEKAVIIKGRNNSTLLHLAAKFHRCLKPLLNLVPEAAKTDVVMACDDGGNNVAHYTLYSSKSLKLFLNWLPQKDHFTVFMARNKDNCTALEQIAKTNPKMLIQILNTFSETERRTILQEKFEFGNGMLHLIASNHPKYLIQLLDYLLESERIAALTTLNGYGWSVLHILATKGAQLFINVLNCLPSGERAAALAVTDNTGLPVVHQILSYSPIITKQFKHFLPEADRAFVVKLRDAQDSSLLHSVAVKCAIALSSLLNSLNEEERVDAVMTPNSEGNNELYQVIHHTGLVKVIMECLPQSARAGVVTSCNKNGISVLHYAASYPDLLDLLLNYLPEAEQDAVMMLCTSDDFIPLKSSECRSRFDPLHQLRPILNRSNDILRGLSSVGLSSFNPNTPRVISSPASSSASDSSPIYGRHSLFKPISNTPENESESELDTMNMKRRAL
ncbi:Ankyrin repeats (3 copies) [Legionella moravica]|uniref:Ankyrin repeats (3 copies) n=1 Tax=Legionella moravica TaxID=39962 RepID=A0A378JYV6_9GAMM|nr:hypothetical protein [Legionella moravica]KTD33645.1 Ankyrin repeats (3 copies) [Legionella moravica]STX62578.1 Ankyrin repeats (3 copies) [Legionella moravica]